MEASLRPAVWRLAGSLAVTAAIIVGIALAWSAWKRSWSAHAVEDAIITTSLVVAGVGGLVAYGDLHGRGFGVQYAQTASAQPGNERATLAARDLLSTFSFAARVLASALLVGGAALVARYATA